MNWSDWVVLALIAGFGIVGLAKGFIMSVFRLASFFVSAIVAIKFYPFVSKILMNTALHDSIWNKIYKSLLLQQQSQVPKVNGEVKKAAADTIIENFHLPGFLKENLIEKMPDPSKLVDLDFIARKVSDSLTGMVIDIVSLILLYVLIRIGLIFLRFILQGIAKLPIFKQVDKLGGFALGAVEGLLTIYIVCAVVMLFQTSPKFQAIYQAIDSSVIAKYFYEHNIIVNFMFPNK
ncbi:MAG: CvpA family protein [Clostridia bacterium]|nr:CvpA family protein [Clostridia bacterium]